MGSMNLALPTEGGDDDTWDTLLNTALGVIEEHDHTSGNGARVPTAGLSIDADLAFATHAATGLKAVSFATVAAYTTAKSLFVSSSDSELYWRSSGGTNVKLTNGATLNTSLIGGITGDYAGSTADVEYVDAEKAFEIKQAETPDYWAKIKVGDIKLFETASGITNSVTLKSPSGLAANYTVTFPTAVPASTALVQMSSAGVLSTTATPSMTSLTASGAISGASLAGTTSVTTAEGDIRHGDVIREVPLMGSSGPGTTSGIIGMSITTGVAKLVNNDTDTTQDFVVKLPLKIGDRLKTVTAIVGHNTSGNIAMAAWKTALSGSVGSLAASQLGSTQSSASSANVITLTISSLTETTVSGTTYHVHFSMPQFHSSSGVYGLWITYDRP